MDAALTGADLHHGRPGTRIRHHHLLADHQVPRPALPGAVRRDPADVRHPGDLPGLVHPGALPGDPAAQPDDADRGGFPLRLPGRRRLQSAAAAVLLRLYGGGGDDRYGDF